MGDTEPADIRRTALAFGRLDIFLTNLFVDIVYTERSIGGCHFQLSMIRRGGCRIVGKVATLFDDKRHNWSLGATSDGRVIANPNNIYFS